MRRRSKLTITAGVIMVLVTAIWLILAPSQLGGATSYVIIDGNSMEPKYQRGDLVLVREADNYQIGDVVTYRHPEIGPVIHRIIARDGSRYVFQGDHNSFKDGYEPVEGDLLGKEWVHLPGIGSALTGARSARNLAILVGIVGVIVMSSFMGAERAVGETTGGASGNLPATDLLKFVTVVAVAATLVAAVGFSRRLHTPATTDVSYTQKATFNYAAKTVGGEVIYDSGSASAGEPIFRRVSDSVDVGFQYSFSTDAPSELNGTWRLIAEISDINGWRRTIELQPETQFQGDQAGGSATLQFARVQNLIDEVEKRTAVDRSLYRLAIVPEIEITGTLDGVPFAENYTPHLPFLFDDLQLQMEDTTNSAGSLSPSKEGEFSRHTQRANSISILAWHIGVGTARTWSLISLAGCVCIGIFAMLYIALGRQRVVRRHVQVKETIEVRAWADLTALSRRLDSPVQSEIRGRYRRYYVEANNLTWQFFDIVAHSEPAL